MRVTAKIETKIKLLKTLKETLANDKAHNQIAKLQAKLSSQKKEIASLEKELISLGQSYDDHTFIRKGVTLASVTQNADGFKKEGFFKEIGSVIHAKLGSKNATVAMQCITSTREKFTTKSGTWKLQVV